MDAAELGRLFAALAGRCLCLSMTLGRRSSTLPNDTDRLRPPPRLPGGADLGRIEGPAYCDIREEVLLEVLLVVMI